MIKHSLTIKDLSNSHLHAKFNEVVTLFRELSIGTGLGNDVLILEEFGTTLVQLSWSDDTGFYVRYRLHPLYSHMPKLVDASRLAQLRFAGIFGKSQSFKVDFENIEDRNGNITVYVATGTHSIGD
jgi:hypothetical protein